MLQKIKRGDIVGKQNSKGVVVGKWKDKREVHFLSTKHTLEMSETGRCNQKGEVIMKPLAIQDYNKGKQGVDLSDQMSSYCTPLRKTIRWYHKVVFELLLSTAVVNSWIIFKHFHLKQIEINEFREQLVLEMLGIDKDGNPVQQHVNIQPLPDQHKLLTTTVTDNNNRKIRRRCKMCYAEASKKGRAVAQKTVKLISTKCIVCDIYMCVNCFMYKHKKQSLSSPL